MKVPFLDSPLKRLRTIFLAVDQLGNALARQGLSLAGWLGGGLIIADALTDFAAILSEGGGDIVMNAGAGGAAAGGGFSDVNVATGKSQIARDAGQVRSFSNDKTNSAGADQGFGGSSVGNAANANTDAGGNPSANLGGISEEAPLSF